MSHLESPGNPPLCPALPVKLAAPVYPPTSDKRQLGPNRQSGMRGLAVAKRHLRTRTDPPLGSLPSPQTPAAVADFLPYDPASPSPAEMEALSRNFYRMMRTRRTVREFDPTPIPRTVIADLLRAATTAPSGAHKQPWHFCVVTDPELRRQIRAAAEREEYENYHGRMSEEWLNDLAPFGTDWRKPFLTEAPFLIVVFKKPYDIGPDGERQKNYYVNESVGIACGLLITAIHTAGLVTVTHTPSPMNFLRSILRRPDNERAYLLLPVGRPAAGARVPAIERKEVEEVVSWF